MKTLHPKYIKQKYLLLDTKKSKLPHFTCHMQFYKHILRKHPLLR